jgi:hypothetical protein
MKRSDDKARQEDRDVTGLCDEAQADGVPCYESGRQCDTCERARPENAPPAGAPPARKSPPRKR